MSALPAAALAALALSLGVAPAAAAAGGPLSDVGHGPAGATTSAMPAPSPGEHADHSAHTSGEAGAAGHPATPAATGAHADHEADGGGAHEEAAGHADPPGHDEDSGDGPGGARPVVLGSFAVVNAAVIAGAGVLRLRGRTPRPARRRVSPGRLP